jgi:hypothetical protein
VKRLRESLRRPAVAALVLAAALLALTFLNDPRGYLGTDTGGKVATLRAMEKSGSLDPDVGYWAARWDPTGRFHPLYFTSHVAGKWVNVTTLPAVDIAYPLFRLGGYRGALLVPIAGVVLAALAARALARRLARDDDRDRAGRWAFWLVGLASPLTIYALDFWEHSLGVALVAWAIVLLLDVGQRTRRWPWAVAAGLLFGGAATMRTEALVYAAVATAVTCVYLLWRHRQLAGAVLTGLAVVVGLAVPLAANVALERATIGTSLRAERAADTLRNAGAKPAQSRVEEAAMTGLALEPDFSLSSYLVGAVLLGLVVLVARRGQASKTEWRVVRLAAAGVVALYLIRLAGGFGFVPGLFAAAPLAGVGLAWAWKGDRSRVLALIAVLALPLVWAVQYTGGAAPQWGGRYILHSGLLLGVIGIVALSRLDRRIAVGAIVLAAVVTAFGVGWLSIRSHDVAHAGVALAQRPEPVLISRVGHLMREEGWFLDGHRWLTAVSDDDVRGAAQVVTAAGFDRFGLVDLDAPGAPLAIPGFSPSGVDHTEFIAGVQLRITTYVRSP